MDVRVGGLIYQYQKKCNNLNQMPHRMLLSGEFLPKELEQILRQCFSGKDSKIDIIQFLATYEKLFSETVAFCLNAPAGPFCWALMRFSVPLLPNLR